MHLIFILLVVTLLGSCEASKDSIFNFIYSSYQNKDKNGIASENDYNQIRKGYLEFPGETLEAIIEIGNIKMTYFVLKILKSVSYVGYKRMKRPADRRKIISKIFVALNRLITALIMYSRVNFDKQKRLFELIVSLMRRTDYSDTIITIMPLLIKRFTITTKHFVDAFSIFVRTLEDDSVGEFKKAYYQLKELSKRIKNGIPDEHGIKARIYSLIFTCSYHSHFNRIDADPERSDPLMLAFLLWFRCKNDEPEYLFRECASGSMKSEILQEIRGYPEIEKILNKYGFEGHAPPGSLLSKIIAELGYLSWHFRVYLRLSSNGNPLI
jgi:hypothetical protein